MKAIGWKGLVALAALLVVPLTATPVMAEAGTWFLNGDLGGGVFITNPWEVPCDILNAQLGAGGLTDHVLMGIRLENVNGVAGTFDVLRIQSRNTKADMIQSMRIYMESGVGSTGPGDFDPGTDTQIGSTVDLSASAFWWNGGTPTAAAEFTGLGVVMNPGDIIFLYVVVDFRATILGDPNFLNAGVGVQLNGTLPSIEFSTVNFGDGPVVPDGPSGVGQIVTNDPELVYRAETRSPMYDFATAVDADPNDIEMGRWDLEQRTVIGPFAGTNRVVMGLWIDNTRGHDDKITNIRLRSRVTDDFAVSKISVYKESDCGVIPTASAPNGSFNAAQDDLWFVDLSPGAFSWNKNEGGLVEPPYEDEGMAADLTIVGSPGAGEIPAGKFVYLYVVVDLDGTVMTADQDARERYTDVEVGVCLNNSDPLAVDPESFVFQSGVTGPRELGIGNTDRAVVHNELADLSGSGGTDWSIFNWQSGDPAESGGQPYIIDALPPEFICLPFTDDNTGWNHSDFPTSENLGPPDNGDGIGDEVIDNLDALIARIRVNDPGPAGLVESSVKTDLRPFGMDPSGHYVLMSRQGATDRFEATVTNGSPPVPGIADSDVPVNFRTDTASGQLFIEFKAQDDAGNLGSIFCPVNMPVDTRRPSFSGVPIEFGFAPGGDLNGDGIVSIGDIIRLRVNMGANWMNANQVGQSPEIQSLIADLSSWQATVFDFDPLLGKNWDNFVELMDESGDGQWFSADFHVPQGTRNGVSGSDLDVILTARDNSNNMREKDDVAFPLTLDNYPPIPAAATWTLLTDDPDNNVANIGDVVRFRADLSDPENADVETVTMDLFEAGLGGSHVMNLADSSNSGVYELNWTILDPRSNNSQAWSRDETPHADLCPVPAVPIDHGELFDIPMVLTDTAGNTFTVVLSGGTFPYLDNNPAIHVSTDTRIPESVQDLSVTPMAGGVLELNWTNPPDGANPEDTKDGPLSFDIYWDEGDGGDPDVKLAEVTEVNNSGACFDITSWNTDETVASRGLDCGQQYKFMIVVRDNANNSSEPSVVVGGVTDCYAPEMCVFEPDPGGLYSAASGLTIFVQPTEDDYTLAENEDVQEVAIMARLQDEGDGPGPWIWVSPWIAQSAANDTHFEIEVDADAINSLFSSCGEGVVEFIVRTRDAAGNENTIADAMGDCDPIFWVNWAFSSVDGRIVNINDDFIAPQPFCNDLLGYSVEGASNTVDICAACGTEPYKVKALIQPDGGDPTTIYYAEDLDSCSSFNLDVTNFQGDLKEENTLIVVWVDATGAVDTATTMICVRDIVAPCARITNPIDGKCINIAQSMANTIPIDVCLNTIPGEVCVDQQDLLKVELQWADYCCEGEITKDSSFFRWQDCSTDPGNPDAVCDTFPAGATGFLIDSIVCVDTAATCSLLVRVDTTFTIPCEEDWNRIDDITAGDFEVDCGHYEWWNGDALANYQTGDVIYLRGKVFDVQGNIFYTPCVQVCLDREAPPMCMWTPDECGTFDGTPKVRDEISIVAELNLDQGQVDDIAWVYLYYKKSTDPDVPSSWTQYGESGFIDPNGGTNSTVWRWTFDTDALDNNEMYDFRVIPVTVTDRWAWDADGDGMFDAYTFSADSCDMTTWFIDNTAPQVAIDTAWTDINGTQIAIPTPACSLSDPKGWIWGQYGEPITVQATAYPLGDIDDIWKVRWTLYDDQATCACDGGDAIFDPTGGLIQSSGKPGSPAVDPASAEDYWILGERFGTNWDDFRTMTFNVADYVPVQDGYWQGVLYVELWDSCGNKSWDCVEVFILDTDPTDAIVYKPKNDAVVCGEVLLQARSLMGETIDKVTFYYEQDGETVTIGDGVKVGPEWKNIWEYTWITDDGNLHPGAFTVWAVSTDNALNVQETIYPKTLYLSCAQPTVDLLTPQSYDETGEFLGGCDIQVTADASTPDVINNPVVEVCFYYHPWLQEFSYDGDNLIGCDEFSTTTTFGVTWNPDENLPHDGKYYIDAVATNKAGQTTVSDPVLVHFDGMSPYAQIIEVNGDGTDGGQFDPTVISIGDMVDIYAFAGDSLARHGVGEFDNCGVDSVIFYVKNLSGTNVYGTYLMGVDREIDSLFMGQWPTGTFAPGDYRIQVRVFDCACHSSWSDSWYVRLIGEPPAGTLAIDAPTVCDYPSVVDEAHFTFEPAPGVINPTVYIYVSNAISDVYDQYTQLPGAMQYDSDDGLYHWDGALPPGFNTEGLYMVRADIRTTAGSDIVVADDADGDGKFDDFSFNTSKPYHMMVRVDQSATPFTVALDAATIKAHSTVEVTVTPDEACDVDEVCYGLVAVNGNEAEGYCFGDLVYDLDPIDSGFVSLDNGIWGGQVRVRVTDPLGNTRIGYSDGDLWVLDIDDDGAMVIEPRWGEYVTGTSAQLTARKLTSSSLSDVTFFYGAATGAGTEIAGDVTQSGDEFYVTWDLEDEAVPEGEVYLWTDASPDNRVRVIVSKGVTGIVLNAPVPNFTKTVGNRDFMFVGSHADLCLDREALNIATNGVEIEKVVFAYRRGDAPGVPFEPYPEDGWVEIGTDQYGSLCTDWFTPCNPPGCSDLDGSYAVAAWVYSRAGTVDHSNIVQVMVDCSPAYTEIVDIDGDETFEQCHQITIPDDVPVKFSAVAIDDCPCVGPDEGRNYLMCNSGARYLQFYVGACGEQALGKVDIVWAIDGSGSMGDDQAAIASGAQDFFNGLSGADFRLGVVGFGGDQCGDPAFVMAGDGTSGPGGANKGEWTRDASAFAQMATGVGDGNGGIEEGLQAVTDALDWYDWRPGALRVVILVTDEGADDVTDCGHSVQDFMPGILASGATVHTVLGDELTGYETLAQQTGGEMFDITGSWGSTLAALASNIAAQARSGNGNDVGIIWGQQIDLTDGDQYPDNPFAYWDPSGVPTGTYCAWTVVIDEVGNTYTSDPVEVCIEDTKAPVAEIAGFMRTHDCCDSSFYIFARSCDEDIAFAQFQYRKTSSTVATDWTTIGLAGQVGNDPTLWKTSWNPCLLDGPYDIRMVPTDVNGNENFEIQPIVHVSISDCQIAMAGESMTDATVGFEDKTFENLGLVNIENADEINCHTVLALYGDLNNGLDVEKVAVRQDYEDSRHYMGSFDDSSILNGGEGWFWAGMTDLSGDPPYTTKLAKGMLTVYMVDDIGFPGCVNDADLGATVCVQPGALDATNGVVLFPARFPTLSLTQLYMQAWPNTYGNATAIRLTTPLEDGFNIGKYATITLSYDETMVADAGLTDDDLAIGWWDGDEWNTVDDMVINPDWKIEDGVAKINVTNLHGIYAVVSAGRECNSFGPIEVEHMSASPSYGSSVGSRPVIKTMVRSKIHGDDGNYDIDPSLITVKIDGVVVYSRGDNAEGWLSYWDNTSGILTTRMLETDNPDDFFADFDNVYHCGDASDIVDYLCYYGDYNYAGIECDEDNGDTGQSTSLCCRLLEYLRNYYECQDGYLVYNRQFPVMDLDCGEHTIEVDALNRSGYRACDSWSFNVDCNPPDVQVVHDDNNYACPNPTFTFTITDDGAGVDWQSVYVDVYEYTASQPDQWTRKSRLLHTETPDAWLDGAQSGNEVSFQLTFEQAQYDGFRIVIYDGNRSLAYNEDCGCEFYTYDHPNDGVMDMVGNHTQIVEQSYVVNSAACTGVEPGVGPEVDKNPFDPFAGDVAVISLNGFTAGGGTVQATVYDLTGERVATLTPSSGTVAWDGRTFNGDVVAEGVYLIHLQRTGGAAGYGAASTAMKIVVKRAD